MRANVKSKRNFADLSYLVRLPHKIDRQIERKIDRYLERQIDIKIERQKERKIQGSPKKNL